MQMINNEHGVTLTVLVITIIVTIMIASISINFGLDSINSTKDRNLQVELEIVGQVAITEYTKAAELDYIKSGEIPANFIGERLTTLPNRPSGDFWSLDISVATGEKSYFRLTPNDLEDLGITNSENTYIINYYTGEVYNETKQKASNGDDLYIKMDNSTHSTKPNDTTSFIN